jgi:hypothetical protein
MDALGWAYCGAKFAADALFHSVLVTVEHMTTVEAFRFGNLGIHLLGSFAGHTVGGFLLATTEHSSTGILSGDLIF